MAALHPAAPTIGNRQAQRYTHTAGALPANRGNNSCGAISHGRAVRRYLIRCWVTLYNTELVQTS